MPRSKTIVISQPMDARHVGGVNVKGSGASSLDNYFNANQADPSERSSPSPDASKKMEARGRSDTILSTPRRSGVSWKDSLSRLRQKSFSPHSRSRRGSEERCPTEIQVNNHTERPDNSTTALKMQPGTTRLGQRFDFESDSDDSASASKSHAAKVQDVSTQLQDVTCTPRDKKALARLTTASSIYSTTTDLEPITTPMLFQRKPLQRQPFTQSSKSNTSDAKAHAPPSHAKPKRSDLSTAIEFDNVPADQRPIPFQEIMAVQNLQDRLAMYKKTREYWAMADHGLGEWVERAVAPKGVVV